MNNLKIGDLVKIYDIGRTYSSYEEMARFFNMKNWQREKLPNEDNVYEIINIHEHLNYTKLLAYIRNIENDKEYIINVVGLKLYKRYEFIKEEEMRID